MSTKTSIENPYRHGGCYHAITGTLVKMGLNKSHRYEAFLAKLKSGWEGFKEWASKEKRNSKTGKDADARIFQNVRVLQRTKDFAKPLLAAGAVIDLTYDDRGRLTICLNSKSRKPQKPGRAPKQSQPVAPRAREKRNKARKPAKAKKVAQKRSVNATEPTLTASPDNSAATETN